MSETGVTLEGHDAVARAIAWPDPTPDMLDDPVFDAIWSVIKTWDVAVPQAYSGYCGATGNHARAILDAITPALTAAEKRGADQREDEIKRAFQRFIVRFTRLDPDDSWNGLDECVMSIDAELRARSRPDERGG